MTEAQGLPPYRAVPVGDFVLFRHEHDATNVCLRCALEREHEYREQAADLQRRIDSALRMIQSVDPTSGSGRMNTFLNDLQNVLNPPSDGGPS